MKTKGKGTLNTCPICNADDISASDSDGAGDHMWQEVRCNVCETEWTEDFKSTGWELKLNGKTGEEFNQ